MCLTRTVTLTIAVAALLLFMYGCSTMALFPERPKKEVVIYWAKAVPYVVEPGGKVEVRVRYKIVGDGPFFVREVRTLLKEGVMFGQPVVRPLTKGPGFHTSAYAFTVPPRAKEGTYVVRTALIPFMQGVSSTQQQIDAEFQVKRV